MRLPLPSCILLREPFPFGSPETDVYMWDETPGRLPRMSANDSPILGVAGGLAAHYGVSPTLVRLAFVLATFLFLAGLLAYVALAFAMPWPPLAPRPARTTFIAATAPIVALTLASTLAAVVEVEGFSLYYLWAAAALSWVLLGFVLSVLFLASRMDLFMGAMSALGLGMLCLAVTGALNLLTGVVL